MINFVTCALREFVIVLEPYVMPEEDFVRQLLSRPRECYRQAGVESWRQAHGEQALLLILQDVSGCMKPCKVPYSG